MTAVYMAFLEQNVWRQAELADRAGVRVPALRKVLEELQAAGMPLESERDDQQVFWSIPKNWYPGGALLDQSTAVELLRELWRLPETKPRARLIARLLKALPASHPAQQPPDYFLSSAAAAEEAAHLALVEDARARRVSLDVTYYTASTGVQSRRHLTVHVISAGPPARFVATCHRAGELRWFRVDGIIRARLDELEGHRPSPDGAVERFVRESADHFHEPAEPVDHVFFVADPEARWFERNLIAPMVSERVPGGIRVACRTAGALRVARVVVSLGGAATPETEPLRTLVHDLAKGALEAARAAMAPRKTQPAAARVNERAVTAIGKGR